MTSDHDGISDGHGPRFVGIDVQLLVRYLQLDQAWLLATIEKAGIQVDMEARPLFLDMDLRLLPSGSLPVQSA